MIYKVKDCHKDISSFQRMKVHSEIELLSISSFYEFQINFLIENLSLQ